MTETVESKTLLTVESDHKAIETLDHMGRVRTEFTEAETAAMTSGQLSALADLLEARQADQDAQKAFENAQTANRELVREIDELRRAGEKKWPPMTPHAAYKAFLEATSISHRKS